MKAVILALMGLFLVESSMAQVVSWDEFYRSNICSKPTCRGPEGNYMRLKCSNVAEATRDYVVLIKPPTDASCKCPCMMDYIIN